MKKKKTDKKGRNFLVSIRVLLLASIYVQTATRIKKLNIFMRASNLDSFITLDWLQTIGKSRAEHLLSSA